MAMSTQNPSFPYEDDESAVTVKLYGRNTVPEVCLNGWTRVHPDLGGLSIPKKRISEIELEDLYKGHVRMITSFTKKRTIKEIEEIVDEMSYPNPIPLSYTLDVVVINKIAVEISVIDGKAILFGRIVVADLTDSCSVKFFGAGIGLLYDELDVGDRILITAGTIKKFDTKPSLCIEVGEFKAKSIYKLIDMKYPIFKYISSNTKLMTPSEIIKCWEDESSQESLMNTRIDVIGVITHVSRLERVKKYECPTTIVKPTGEVTEDLKQFKCLCWIELIDGSGATPLPVLIHINSKLWNLRQKILPGSIVVLTHVNFSTSEVWMDYAKTTSSTSMFTNNEIKEYEDMVECFPTYYPYKTPFADQLLKFGLRSEAIIERCTMNWSVGGSYILPVKNDDEFLNLYDSKYESDDLWPCKPSLNLERRECETIIFQGYILSYTFFDNELSYQSNEEGSWKMEEVSSRFPKRSRTSIVERTVVSKSSHIWSMFSKKLPIFVEDISNKHYLEAFETISESTKKYSAAYQMPAGKLEEAQELPFVDAFPHYVVDIYNISELGKVDEHGVMRKLFIWKVSRNQTIENMKKKLEASQTKNTIFIAKISRIETPSAHDEGYELILEDIFPMRP